MTTWARAQPYVEEIDWDFWRDELTKLAAEMPRFSIVLASARTGQSFGGLVPGNWNGETMRIYV